MCVGGGEAPLKCASFPNLQQHTNGNLPAGERECRQCPTNLYCSNVQLTSSSQVISAHQENVTDALQLVTAEHQGGSSIQQDGRSIQQQVSATQIGSDGSEQVSETISIY